ncbi:MAG: CtsR family transcriptional regulator [Clostridia bacterium]|nr:CtsR family transcriptional regulator [Clostridia bacterium]MBR2327470.1 CtsR family transcriptional regulator [Clostridia bacterium]
MRSSDIIYEFLKELADEEEGVKFRRNELAGRFGVVPSQINYVVSSRFTPEQGYVVESVRGGGGYILIRRVSMSKGQTLMHIINSVGSSIDGNTVRIFLSNMLSSGYITESESAIIASALSESSLSGIVNPDKDRLRARIFKNMLAALANSK